MNILLVDDSDVDIKVAQRMLRKLGHKVDLARNGIEAINALERCSYSMVFMDIQMPMMNGIEATKVIRQKCHPCPIIIFSSSLSEFQNLHDRFGGDDFIAKPLRMDELRHSLQYYDDSVVNLLASLELNMKCHAIAEF